jgi:hypothetical protein
MHCLKLPRAADTINGAQDEKKYTDIDADHRIIPSGKAVRIKA